MLKMLLYMEAQYKYGGTEDSINRTNYITKIISLKVASH